LSISRLLVVGGGSVGERHIRCFLKVRPRLRVELCEPRRERAVELLSRYPLVTVHPDFAGVDLSRFDAAVLATPAKGHVAQATELAAQGRHVLIEKPLCVSAGERSQVRALIRAARKNQVVAGVGYTYRSYPLLVRMAKQVSEEGKLGKPFLARVTMAYYYPDYRRDYRRNYFARPKTGGGALLDIASHAVAYLTGVLGAVETVQAETGHLQLKKVPVEDTALLNLRFRKGALAQVWASACQPRRQTEIEIIGAGGHLRWINTFDGHNQLGFRRDDRDAGRRARRSRLPPDQPFESQARNFLAAVEGRERIRTTLAEALHVQEVCWAARRSGRSGRRVRVRGA